MLHKGTAFRARRLALALISTFLLGGVNAQSLTEKPVTLVVAYGAGSGSDLVARILVDALSKQLGRPVIIDNKPGALGQIAVSHVRRSAPDGHTLLLGESGVLVFYPLAKKPAPFDPLKDFVQVSLIAESGLTWLVPAQSGYKSAKEFVERQKGKDKTMVLTVALTAHVATSLFAELGGFKYEPVSIRSAGDVLPLIASGDAEGVFVTHGFAAAQVGGGKVAALMQTGESRSKLLPNTPTAAEAGFPATYPSNWANVVAPAGTPDAIVQQLNRAIVAAVQDPSVRQKLEGIGFDVIGSSSEQMQRRLAKDLSDWKPIVDRSNISVP